MRKIIITASILVVIGVGILLAGRQGVIFQNVGPMPANTIFKFMDNRGGSEWITVPVEADNVNLGWRIIGRYKVLTYRIESDGKTINEGHVTIPRLGYARVHLDAND